MVTCMQKKAKIESKSPQEQHVDHLHEKEGEDQVQLNPKCHDGHLHAEEGEDQVQFNPERQGSHLQAEVVEDQIPPKLNGCHHT